MLLPFLSSTPSPSIVSWFSLLFMRQGGSSCKTGYLSGINVSHRILRFVAPVKPMGTGKRLFYKASHPKEKRPDGLFRSLRLLPVLCMRQE